MSNIPESHIKSTLESIAKRLKPFYATIVYCDEAAFNNVWPSARIAIQESSTLLCQAMDKFPIDTKVKSWAEPTPNYYHDSAIRVKAGLNRTVEQTDNGALLKHLKAGDVVGTNGGPVRVDKVVQLLLQGVAQDLAQAGIDVTSRNMLDARPYLRRQSRKST